jgi:hypothetical protein
MNQVNNRNVILVNYPNISNTNLGSLDDEYEIDYDDEDSRELNDDFLISSKDCLSYYMPVLTNKINHPLESTNLSNDISCLNNSSNLVNSVNTITNSKQHQEKYHVLKEILSSEKKYLNDLREIVEVRRYYIYFEILNLEKKRIITYFDIIEGILCRDLQL